MTEARQTKLKLWLLASIAVAAALLATIASRATWAGADGTDGTGTAPQPEPTLLFADDTGVAVDFVVLPSPGDTLTLRVAVSDLDLITADTFQAQWKHDLSVTTIHSASCVDLFSGAFSPPDVTTLDDGSGSAFMCSLPQDAVGQAGNIIEFTIERVAGGTDFVEFGLDGAF
jgi:hypothetical protein